MLMFFPSDWPTLQVMLSTLVAQIPQLNQLVSALSYIAGLYFTLRATYVLKEYGELRTMTASQTTILRPAMLYIVGAVLLFLPTVYHIGIGTIFGQYNPTVFSYSTGDYQSWRGIESVVIQIVQFIGIVAFIRGWFILAAFGSQGTQPGTFGKAMSHIIGGVLAINIVGFTHVLESSIGMTVNG